MKLSIVSPVYMAENIVDELVKRVTEEACKVVSDFEIILVEDGGEDNSWKKIEENCLRDSRVKGIKLSRNFGQHYAISAGLEASTGDYVILMDCDLQDDPKYFGALIEKTKKGFQIVYTVIEERKHSFFKNITANFFYKVFNFLVRNDIVKGNDKTGTYSLISRDVVNAYIKVGDYRRHYLMVLRWLGFSYDFLTIKQNKRFAGKSSYNLRKLLSHALDGITSQSDRLLRLTAGLGLVMSLLSFIAAISIVISYMISPFQAGWASIITLILFVSGLIILCIGICGIYIGKIFEQTKNRPLYVISEKRNF